MTNQTRLENVAKSVDTENLLEHISWAALVKPALQKKRDAYTALLVGAVLGGKLPDNLTKEQIAGFVYGIDEIIKTFEDILTRGSKALADLEGQGFHLQKQEI